MRFLRLTTVWAACFFLAARMEAKPLWHHIRPLPVLLVHGIYDDGTALRPLQTALEAAGYRCFTPTLKPANGSVGIQELARQLRQETNRHFGPRQPFVAVAFSLGGLVARCYLEELGGAARCRGLITVSTPHAGTLPGYLIGGRGARDLRPFSPFLRDLRRNEAALKGIPRVSCWNPLDLVIFPSFSSTCWAGARDRVVLCSSHPVMIRSRVLIRVVMREVEQMEPPL